MGVAVTFLELASLVASGATVFALIAGVFSVRNGRMTRREIGGMIERTQELIAREEQATRDLTARMDQGMRELLGRLADSVDRLR